MLNIKKLIIRRILFLGICIPLRITAMILAKKNIFLQELGLFYLIAGIGIGYRYFSNTRLIGAEVFNTKIWWHNYRIIFSIIWLLFAYFAITKKKSYAWMLLSSDVIFGFIIFIYHHTSL
tara:strand:+ start:10485 stop:10844 length:360 start_codon:yes stop_codon:yes gene_type:complete